MHSLPVHTKVPLSWNIHGKKVAHANYEYRKVFFPFSFSSLPENDCFSKAVEDDGEEEETKFKFENSLFPILHPSIHPQCSILYTFQRETAQWSGKYCWAKGGGREEKLNGLARSPSPPARTHVPFAYFPCRFEWRFFPLLLSFSSSFLIIISLSFIHYSARTGASQPLERIPAFSRPTNRRDQRTVDSRWWSRSGWIFSFLFSRTNERCCLCSSKTTKITIWKKFSIPLFPFSLYTHFFALLLLLLLKSFGFGGWKSLISSHSTPSHCSKMNWLIKIVSMTFSLLLHLVLSRVSFKLFLLFGLISFFPVQIYGHHQAVLEA